MANNDNFGRFPRLKGSENWEAWSIRMKALLAKEKLIIAIRPLLQILDPPTDPDQEAQEKYETLVSQYPIYVAEYKEKSFMTIPYIKLALEDGPLYQTQHIKEAYEL